MKIRLAVEEDAKSIAKVHVKSWQESYKGIIEQTYLDQINEYERFEMWKKGLASRNDDAPVYVVEQEDGIIVGFASFGKERTKKYGVDGELYAIYLLDQFKGLKIGTKLFQLGRDHLLKRGIHSFLVWVLAENRSRYFYKSFQPEKLDEEVISIGNKEHLEIAYGWDNIANIQFNLDGTEDILVEV